jgi:hypothetical protein
MFRFTVSCLFTSLAIYAQTVGASLQGTVTDPTGALMPKVKIEIKNVATGIAKSSETSDAGLFREPVLPPGEYELRASAEGFQTVVQKGITLAIGQAGVANIVLQLGRTGTEITVSAQVSTVNTTSGSLSGVVDQAQMRDLPLNGRSFEQLALLQPGVTAAVAAGNDVVGGRGAKISINGARPEQNNFLLDGTDINNVYNKTPGSVAGVLLGVEAVQEFQVLTNAYSAEFGRSSGGVINAITRSGANDIHGSLFHFLRNSKLDARRFHDPFRPPFKRNQFGGVLGGPIIRNKTFFFGAFESLIERLGVTGIASVPDADARRGLLAGRQIQVHPNSLDYISKLLPDPNGRSLGGGIAEHVWNSSQPTNDYFAQGRIDHKISEQDSLYGRFTFSNGNVDRQIPNKPPGIFTKERSRNQYLTLEHQHIFTPGLLNTLRLGYARSTTEADNARPIPLPPSFVPPDPFGTITIQGMVTELGGDFRLPRNDRLNNYQWGNTMFWTRGAHSVKSGAMGQRLQFNQDTVSQRGGVLNFTNLENFLLGRPSSVDLAVPGKVDPIRGYRQSVFGFFVQDDWRLTRKLTMNLGLRYEFATVPAEVNGKISNLRNITDARLTVGSPWHKNNSLNNWAPRLGLAWDPWGDGKTAIRAGFGLFYDLMLPKYYFFSGSLNPPFTTRTSITNPSFPNVLVTPGFDPNNIRAQLQTVNFDLRSTYITQFNFNVQRTLPGNIDVTLGYAGSRGAGLPRLGDANLAPEQIVNGVKTYQPQLGRRNPNFTGVFQRITDARSFYNALQVGVHRRLSRGLRAQLSYTWSKSIDDSSGINSQDFTNTIQYGLDWYDRKLDRGLSSFNAARVAVFNGSWDLPFFGQSKGATGALLKGWQLNSITALQTGMPFSVRMGFNRSGNLNTTGFAQHERPNLKAGCTAAQLVRGGPDRYFNLDCFELPAINTRGNSARNLIIGPGLVSVDLSAVKSWQFFADRSTLQFRLESFNLLNRANFSVPSGAAQITFTNAQGAVSPTWGRITSTIGVPRQLQMSLKLTW